MPHIEENIQKKNHKEIEYYMKQMTYKETREYLEEKSGRGSVLGLDGIKELCKRLGNPQDHLKFIHVAGTNGKGSTIAYLSSILKSAGYQVGTYISPVILNEREKFQINGKLILAREYADVMSRVREAADQMEEEGYPYPTVFELETATGFCYFQDKNCDVVILETGMGGDMDATNLVKTTMVSVFVSISMDHMAFLGNTLSEIAEKKAGIIKPGADVVSTWQPEEVQQVLNREAGNKKAEKILFASRDRLGKVKYGLEKQRFDYGCASGNVYRRMEIALAGTVQIDNAALALEVVECLKERGFYLPEDKVRKGLFQTKWPGRLEIIAKKPYFLVDGAHNEDAAKRLAQAIHFYFTNKKIVYIMGILKDKEYEKIIAETSAYAEQIITIATPDRKRTLSSHELALAVKEYHPNVTEASSLEEAVEIAYLLAGKEDVIIAFGSLSYLGALKKIMADRSGQHGKSGKSKRSH